MPSTRRGNLFAAFLEPGATPFRRREALLPQHKPTSLPHRQEQLQSLAAALSPLLRGERAGSQLLFGTTGTGKSACAVHVLDQLEEAAASADRSLIVVHLNGTRLEGSYQVLVSLARGLPGGAAVPIQGWPLERLYEHLRQTLDALPSPVVLCLDELDSLAIPQLTDVLSLLGDLNGQMEGPGLSFVGILNNSALLQQLDPRAKGRLGAQPIVFPPYDASQLRDILQLRADLAFHLDALEAGVVPLCAALAAQEHGDARRALDLLRASGDEAARSARARVAEVDVRAAASRIEGDLLTRVALGLPLPARLLLLGAADATRALGEESVRRPSTRAVLRHYRERCTDAALGESVITRGTELLAELDCLGLLEVPTASVGRQRRGVRVCLSDEQLQTLVEVDERLGEVLRISTGGVQSRLV